MRDLHLKDQSLLEKLDFNAIPRHVGLIMDGNGRWAQKQKKPRMLGHRAGMEQLRSAVRFANNLDIEVLSIYAFSSENWRRPEEEIKGLMRLLLEYMKKELAELDREGVQIRFMGDIDQLPAQVYEALSMAQDTTLNNQGLIFNIGINYGGQQEVVRACRLIAEKVKNGQIDVRGIDEGLFAEYLYTTNLPPLDVVIRTSGEERLSNFMLYQVAYAELVFTEVLWPDFNEDVFCQALIEYQKRSRRFGAVDDQ